MPPNLDSTWRISAHGEPAFARYRCDGRWSSTGRSQRKVGLFGSIFVLSTSRDLSLSIAVSLKLKLAQTVENFYRSPRRGDAR